MSLRHASMLALTLATASPAAAPTPTPELLEHGSANPSPSAAYRWLDIVLEACARSVERDNLAGLELGQRVATATWPRYQALFAGTQTPPLRSPPQ